MERRADANRVVDNLRSAIQTSGNTLESVATATDTTNLTNPQELTVTDLVRVGGFLRIPTKRFFEGITA